MNAMLTNGEAPMDVIEEAKKATKKTYTNSGHLIAGGAHIEHRPTFTDVRYMLLFKYTDKTCNMYSMCNHSMYLCLPYHFYHFVYSSWRAAARFR